MADIVLGVGTSHGPQIHIPPEQWSVLQEKDLHDRRLNYAQLEAIAPAGLDREITPEVWRQRWDHCMEALDWLGQRLEQIRPDVVVMVGDDQHEQFLDDNMPMFSVYWGESVLVKNRRPRDVSESGHTTWHDIEARAFPDGEATYAAHPALARHLIEYLRQHEVDVAASNQVRADVGLGHAFAFLYRRLLRDRPAPAIVPVMVNTFYPPNQPTPKRCYRVGELLAEAIRAWPSSERVAVVASGGLSHVIMDEGFDRLVLQALTNRDMDTLQTLPEAKLQLGSSEIRCWITAAGALSAHTMTVVAYEPCYRSRAGTGCGMAFALWQ